MWAQADRASSFLFLRSVIIPGAAQPLMTLIFGKLTASFVTFGNVVLRLVDNPGNVGLLGELADAQRTLKHEAAKDSLYLVIIGIAMFVATYGYMGIWVYTGEGESNPSPSS
jgi:ATP-binding cassette subfamily B (MDR/TAP) protein 1